MSSRPATRQHAARPQAPAAARTALGDAMSALVIQIFQLNGLLTAAGDALAAPAGQTSARWQVLAAIEDAALSVADIARALGLARQSVQRVADLLEADGLLAYEDNPAHQRAKLARLTARGRSALRAIQTAQRAWADRLGAAVGEDHLKAANASIAAVITALREGKPSPIPQR